MLTGTLDARTVREWGDHDSNWARWGGGDDPDSPGDFYAPHDIWVDSRGDVYVAEVKVAAAVSVGDDTSRLPTLRKFVRQ